MRLIYALNCDHAEAHPDGRIDAHAVFHQLWAPGFPAMHRMVLALAVEWDQEPPGPKAFKIDLIDPTGSPAFTINAETEIMPRAEGEAPPRTVLVLPIEEVTFPMPGTYFYEVEIDGVRTVTTPLHLFESAAVE